MPRAIACLGLLLAACGGAPEARLVTSTEHLGVQSNAGAAITLRLAPRGPIAFATDLRVTLASELLGEPMRAELETRGVRRVTEVRSDGSLAIEEIDTATRYAITMMGNTQRGPDAPEAPGEPRRYVLGDRGRRAPEPPGAPPAVHGAPRADADLVQDRLEAAIDPMVRAFELPERAVTAGDEWTTEGTIPFADVDPSMRGSALYRITQRLDHLEGAGDHRLAIVTFRATLEGEGAGAGSGSPIDSGIAGAIQLEGFYALALSDGFARTARARLTGEARLGPEDTMRFPLAGEIAWDAVPIEAGR